MRRGQQEVISNGTEIGTLLGAALAKRVGPHRYDLWFGRATGLTLEDDRLIVGVPNRFFQDFLSSNFRGEIERVCLDVLGVCPSVEFRIDPGHHEHGPALRVRGERASRPVVAECRERQAATNPLGAAGGGSATVSNSAAAPAGGTVASVATPSGAAPAPGGAQPARRRFSDLGSFVTGRTNRLARAAAEMIVERPGELSPLLIYGPTSVGKTHLLEGVWTAARKSRPGLTALYLTAEQFTTGFLQALRGSGLPSFRQKYRGVGLLVIDDLQFFCGKRYTQVELLYTIDAFLREGRQMAFGSDRAPEELSEFGPELCTRLQSGMVCRIESPDYETRLGIVSNMARRQAVAVPHEVQQFIASRLTSHARELSGALCRLQATSQATGKPISLALAEDALADMVRNSSRVIRLPDIEKAVCQAFGLDPATLQSDRKSKRVSQPRMLAMWLARKYTRTALSEIGQFFGRRSHATVISAQKRVDGWLAARSEVELADRVWTVDDAIRQVERCLLAG